MRYNLLISIFIVGFLLYFSGCTTAKPQENKLSKTQDIGVLSFGFDLGTLTPNSENYITITIRNNALGEEAKNIIVSLENVYPFKVLDCYGKEHDPEEERNGCPPNFDKINNVCYGSLCGNNFLCSNSGNYWCCKHISGDTSDNPCVYSNGIGSCIGSDSSIEVNCKDNIDNDGDGYTDCQDSNCKLTLSCLSSTETDCSNGLDDDGDGKIDCADYDCRSYQACEYGMETSCNDNIDNDGDGYTDCQDSDCKGQTHGNFVCQYPETTCNDGYDNDGDGLVDCQDINCNGKDKCEYPETTCNDGYDNDGDGLIDCKDPSCDGKDNCEYNKELTCNDNIDNDGDGYTDCQDSDCVGTSSCPELGNAEICDNGIDDDHDGYTDCDDSDCDVDEYCNGKEITCNDNLDNDKDGLIDCNDPDCASSSYCSTNEVCNDNKDNDGDGKIDCADSDCQWVDPCEQQETTCDDNFDNDGNGCIDNSDYNCGGHETLCSNDRDDDCDGYTDCQDSDCVNDDACQGGSTQEVSYNLNVYQLQGSSSVYDPYNIKLKKCNDGSTPTISSGRMICSPYNEDTCYSYYDLDDNLKFSQHGTSKLFANEEVDFMWRLLSPSNQEIANLPYKHTIYYNIEYDYSLSSSYSLIFMSQEEVVNRRQKGENWKVSGDFYVSSGSLTITPKTVQPLIFPNRGESPKYNLMVSLSNVGSGFLSSKKDVIVTVKVPDGIEVDRENNDNWDISSDGKTCTLNLKPYDLVSERNIYIPIKLSESEITYLQDQQIPLKSYTFYIYVNYTYSLEGSASVNVVPLNLQ